MKHIVYYLPFVFLLFYSQASLAQNAGINGLVSDLDEAMVLEYASVSLFALENNRLIGGTLTDSSGQFELLSLPGGNYYLITQFMGYESDTLSSIELAAGQSLSLGKITLTPTQLLLEEVEITGRKITTFHAADRQVFDVDQFRNAQGGSATDVLRNLPSIEPYGNKEASRRYGADLTLTYKKDKWDLAAGLDYRRDDIGGRRIGYVNPYQISASGSGW